ncbi:MAG: DUF924 domain-containing protein [Phenylobacterium sp.]|uniref:DUF924 family protein n=1 Tax=Phenylobacterium sp. TaxID=1871053 RepID=UPI0025F05EC9|nr:DUF924 family protein [Phenylobacterium sp.]MBA4010343.1 DUF924 domain-containing protein [Phenylobacterium sp.]
MAATPKDVVGFWTAAGPEKWFAKSTKFDEAIALRFEPVHHAAARGEYDGWMASAEGSLALLILLDQFPRNLYRNSGHAFATDAKARHVARNAVASGHDRATEAGLRQFFYLPFEHSEDLADQDEAVRLFTRLKDEAGDAESLRWADLHRHIIVRFGRFPHRNICLGRVSTTEELAFLADGGFAG